MTGARREALLWYAVIGGPLAWAGQYLIGYALEEAACSAGSETETIWGAGVNAVGGGLTIAAGLLAAGALLAGALTWRSLSESDAGSDPRGRARFMAGVGALGSALFLLTIVLNGVAFAGLDSCVPG